MSKQPDAFGFIRLRDEDIPVGTVGWGFLGPEEIMTEHGWERIDIDIWPDVHAAVSDVWQGIGAATEDHQADPDPD